MSQTSPDPTQRFSKRVDDYVKYRPGYPQALIQELQRRTGLNENWYIADMGSGTGISAQLFLKLGATVFGIEPNLAMRQAAENGLASYPDFHSLDATAEDTSLPDASMDLIVSGQAFHWFDKARVKQEWQRVLKKQGYVALFWNSRLTAATPFQRDYENLINTYASDYKTVNHQRITDETFKVFFGGGFERWIFPNSQTLDLDGFKGRLLSSSYIPLSDNVNFEPMLQALAKLFQAYQKQLVITLDYETELFLGKLG